MTVFRWVQRFTPLLIDAARPCRHAPGGSVVRRRDIHASQKRDLAAVRRFFTRALEHAPRPAEVTTDRAPAYPRVLDELLPAACI